jgi:P4 family phage/plasmid primase-like protien
MTGQADTAEIRQALELLLAPDSVAELRCPKTKERTGSGYYDDPACMASKATALSGTVPGVYVTLNPVQPDLLARRVNRFEFWAKDTTTDENILSRRWLPLDFDPVRVSGISSTDAEHEAALTRARECQAELTAQGWPEPVLGDSGNGGHLLYRVDLPNDKESLALVTRTLQALAQKFTDKAVTVDAVVSNAARIWKVYGTLAHKGDATAERPHRYARLLEIPAEIKVVTRAQLEAVAAAARETIPLHSSTHQTKGKPFDVPGWLAEYKIEVRSQGPWEDGTGYELTTCPFNSEHQGTAFVGQFASGAITAMCHHASCQWGWAELREKYEPKPETPCLSEDAVALEFTAALSGDLKYTASMGLWHRWTGTHYQPDESLRAFTEARETCRAVAKTAAAEPDKARRLASSATVSSVERLARYDRRHAVNTDEWDADPWLLNTPGGTVDLRTGEMQPHRRRDYITKLAPVSPGGDCPLWHQFLNRVTAGSTELQTYLQRVVGYCLTGSTREHALFFLYGLGANGKGVFLNTVTGLLQPYTGIAPTDLFLASRNASDRHPCDIAALLGKRLAAAQEIEAGARWAESKIKALTGGDRITARFMRQDFFEYTPQFKLVLVGNHRPGLRSVDEAIRRRFHLVPFTVTIPAAERDPQLSEKLKAEWPGILAWAIDGCLQWQREGLNTPAKVREATGDYFGAEDALGRWIDERCNLGVKEKASSNALFTSWREWAEKAGEYVGSQKNFSQSLEARDGIAHYRTSQTRGYLGISLKTFEELRDAETVKPATVEFIQ